MAPFVLKFKGNKSFSPFSNLSDSDALTKTWRVCTKVASHLEQGQRLENLSWRLWHLHNLMVETDNAKSKREFKKLSKNMGERLDKDKGRSIEELQAPDFRRNQSTDKLRQRAEEKEKHLGRTGIKGMTFTFPVDPTTNKTPGATVVTSTSSAPANKRSHQHARTYAPKDEFDESMEVINSAATGLVIDTNFNNPLDAALTPTSAFIRSSGNTGSATETGDRTHYRGHHDSISSVTSQMSAFPISPSSPEVRMPTMTGMSRTSKQPTQKQKRGVEQQQQNVLRFPSHFENDFTPIALLCPTPSVKQGNTYGEAIGFSGLANSNNHADVFGIARPTFEFALDELMNNAECNSDVETSTSGGWNNEDGSSNLTNSVSSLSVPTPVSAISMSSFSGLQITPVVVSPALASTSDAMQGVRSTGRLDVVQDEYDMDGQDMMEETDYMSPMTKSPATLTLLPSKSAPASPAIFAMSPVTNKSGGDIGDDVSLPAPLTLPKGSMLPGPSPTPSPAPAPSHHVIRRRYSTTNAPEGKKGGRQPSATAPRNARASYGNSAPGGVKSECANCGANSTPLWRRGLNDELNCNACGLFAKLHKRPRPKSLRGSTGEGGTRHPGWASKGGASDETGEPVSCYNCATIATPLWRKDEDGKTLCNACGLYLKLHGERRPSSMKSDVIRKRSRHDSRRGTSSETPSASPGASRRTSPTPPPVGAVGPSRRDRGRADEISFNIPAEHGHSPNGRPSTSPYAPTSNSFEYNTSSSHSVGGQDNSPVDLMSMNHSMTDSGVDPMLGGMTFSPGATYQETLQYPGPFSLSYFYGGAPPASDATTQGQSESNQQRQSQQQRQQPVNSRQAASSTPTVGQGGSPHNSDVMFGPVANPTAAQIDTMSMWDQPFQVPMSTPYSFNYAGNVVQSGTDSQQDQGLGFVHPPMLPSLPYWTADGAISTKAETDHEMSFGHN
ncbi:hypothetical protein FRB95_004841 [Tulasnella sp. JGI-2019a]|nr:hypothetical protein FRB95_004841 [Tulasnella sp. JGI-2019a]